MLEGELVLLELLRVGGGGLREDHEVLHHLLDLSLQLCDLIPTTLLLRLLRLLHLLLLLGSLLLLLLLLAFFRAHCAWMYLAMCS